MGETARSVGTAHPPSPDHPRCRPLGTRLPNHHAPHASQSPPHHRVHRVAATGPRTRSVALYTPQAPFPPQTPHRAAKAPSPSIPTRSEQPAQTSPGHEAQRKPRRGPSASNAANRCSQPTSAAAPTTGPSTQPSHGPAGQFQAASGHGQSACTEHDSDSSFYTSSSCTHPPA